MQDKYTKDRLIREFIEQSKKNTEAFVGVKDALENINDQNKLHALNEDGRYQIIQSMVDSNNKVYKLITTILLLLIVALIVLAGAEKALTLFPF
jgi:hypothetical protein